MAQVKLEKKSLRTLPTAEFEEISPGQAQLWLDDAATNRTKAARWVDRCADMISRGDWLPTDQGIGFNKKGQLINGQHRLTAIVKADKSAILLVVRGLDDRAQLVEDQGRRRTPHEQIHLQHGFNCQPLHIATAKAMLMSVGGVGEQARRAVASDMQLLDRYYVRHRESIEFTIGDFWKKKVLKGVTIAPVYAPVARAFYSQPQDRLRRFLEVVIDGMSEDMEEFPAIVLRNYLIDGREKALSSRKGKDRYLIYKKTEIALAAFLEKRKIQRLGNAILEQELFPIPGEKGIAKAS